MYLSDKLTDEELDKLERRLKKVYSQAWNDLSETTNDYFADFDRRWAVEYQKFLDGKAYKTNDKPDRKKFDAWVRTQIGRGERWAALRDHMGQAIGKTNVKAADMINGVLDNVYALNANYEAFRLEGYNDALDFTLYDRDTVRRLAEGKNAVEFRTKTVNPVRDYAWNKTQIENQLMTGILTGKSPKQIANSFLQVMGRNQAAAIRNARTSITSAQNAGRMDTYRRAKERGTNLQIEWIATWDSRTRTSHAKQDGERIDLDGTFSNGCRYPADPKGAPEEVYNCRCTTRAILPGINDREENENEIYKQWLSDKENDGNIRATSSAYIDIVDEARKKYIIKHPARKIEMMRSKEAAQKVGMPDSVGSCSSVALAYIGNRAGYDVLDFRGGNSMKMFRHPKTIERIAGIEGVDSYVTHSTNAFSTAVRVLNRKIKSDEREYFFASGDHAAIIKSNGKNVKYLELQDFERGNIWKKLTEDTLIDRFGLVDGDKSNSLVVIDAKTLYDKDEFIDILGYVNRKH